MTFPGKRKDLLPLKAAAKGLFLGRVNAKARSRQQKQKAGIPGK